MKSKICLILLLIFLNLLMSMVNSGNAQNTVLDSLENLLSKHRKADTIKINLLNEIAYSSYRTNLDKTYEYASLADSLSEKNDYKKGNAESLKILGIYYSITRDYPQAFENFNQSAKISEEINDKPALAKIYKSLGLTHYRLSNFEKALEYYLQSLQVNKQIGDNAGISECYNTIGSIYLSQGEFDLAMANYAESVTLAKEINDKKMISFGYNNIGLIHYNQGNYLQALDFYEKAIEASKDIDDQVNIAMYYNNMATCFNIIGDAPMALGHYQKSLKIYENADNKAGMSSIYNNIGIIYDTQGDYKKALDYYQKSLKIQEEISDKRGMAITLNNIGIIYKNQGDTDLALEYYYRSLNIYEEIGDPAGVCPIYSNIGDIYGEKEDYVQASIYYNKALELAKEIGLQRIIARSYINMSNLYFTQKQFATAVTYGEKAYALSVEMNDKEKIMEAAEILSLEYAAIQNYKQAYYYHNEFKTQSDSLFNEEEVKKITGLEYQYKYEKEKELVEAEQQKKEAIQEAELKRQKTTRNSFIAGFILMALLAIVILRSFIQKRNSNRILAEQKKEIENQSKQLQITNEKLIELDKFKEGMTGMIVHDLKNPLNVIINSSESEPVKSLKRNKQSGKQMLNMVLNILDVHKYEESKMQLDTKSLALAEISSSAVKEVYFLADQKNIKIKNNILPKTGVVADKEIIERVFTNILTNAIKYTPNYGLITLNINQEGFGYHTVAITDTGEGIAAEKLHLVFAKFGQVVAKKSGSVRSSGLGLTFCKMAVEAHGGNIGVESEPGKGTTFWFTLPESEDIKDVNAATGIAWDSAGQKAQLTATDVEILKPVAEQLQQFMVFEVSEVKRILQNIENTSKGIENWISEINDCTFSMNEDKYKKLLNL